MLTLFWSHWIADFVCQTNNMGVNKSKSFKWLCIHGLSYTVALFFASLFVVFLAGIYQWMIPYVMYLSFKFCLINGILHTATDFFYIKVDITSLEKQ